MARSDEHHQWPRLVEHVNLLRAFTRSPARTPPRGTSDSPADRLLRLACLSYTDDTDTAVDQARAMLRAEPGLGAADAHTQAATGDAESLARTLAADRRAVTREGGPSGWSPVLSDRSVRRR